MMVGGDPPPPKTIKPSKRKSTSIRDNFAEKLIAKNREEDQEQMKKLEAILKRGLREYREGNYFRAIHEFNLALILSPENSRAQFYLSKSQQRLHETIDSLSEKGQREIEANKYLEAKVTFCAILRLLKDSPDDESYKSAEGKIEIIEEELGYVKGELKCFSDR
jgi:tetratricopeptide (TPR) repeat protein